jgi:hypothetical protein
LVIDKVLFDSHAIFDEHGHGHGNEMGIDEARN